jgi:hypothetical protein
MKVIKNNFISYVATARLSDLSTLSTECDNPKGSNFDGTSKDFATIRQEEFYCNKKHVFLRCYTVWLGRSLPMFRRRVSPPSSWMKSKPCNKLARSRWKTLVSVSLWFLTWVTLRH